jgi:16S rRNA (guanine966-N2)-methyltransferase
MTRIVAGRWASRRLAVPRGGATRPTTDRVREAVFAHVAAWLGAGAAPADEQLQGLTFLDLYAGSGAVGLEAASRGATTCWVERDPATARLIERNGRELGAEGGVARTDVVTFLAKRPVHPYDLIWLDPPYDLPTPVVDRLLNLVVSQAWLGSTGLIMIERAGRTAAPALAEGFTDHWLRQYGDTTVYFACQPATKEFP